jgi:hypothetical protein
VTALIHELLEVKDANHIAVRRGDFSIVLDKHAKDDGR